MARHIKTAIGSFAMSLPFRINTREYRVTDVDAPAQSGCLSCGSLLTSQRRQSATRRRQVAGRPAAASDQSCVWQRPTNKQHAARTRQQHASSKVAVSSMVCRPRPKSFGSVQNAATSNSQGSAAMAMPRSIKAAGVVVCSTPSTARTSLTGRSSRRQYWPWLRHFYGQYWYPPPYRAPAPLTLGVRLFPSCVNWLRNEPYAKRCANLTNRVKAGLRISSQCFVQRLARNT